MSGDYADSSGRHPFARDDVSALEPAELRIAIQARSQEAADEFWRNLEKRLHKKNLLAHRSGSSDANVAIHLLTREDFADAGAIDATVGSIVANGAATKILLEPAIADIQAHGRMTAALASFAHQPGYERLALQQDAESASPVRQSKAVAKFLTERFAPTGLISAEKNDGAGGKARDPLKSNANSEKESKNSANAERYTGSSPGTVKDRSERKARRQAERSARPGRKTDLEKPDGIAAIKAPAKDAKRSERKAQKRAAKNDKTGGKKRAKRLGETPPAAG